jgi:hypothetical protein
MNKSVIRTAAIALLALACAWIYFSPYLAVRSFQQAVEAGDVPRISDHVNFPALRESIKAHMLSKVTTEAATSKKGGAFAAMGAVLMSAMMGPLIDAMISPEGLANMLKGEKPTTVGKGSSRGNVAPKVIQTMGYENMNRFLLTTTNEGSSDSVSLVFTREGFSWKLTALRMP